MAANHKAELTEVEQVMKFYELHSEKALFVIYAGVGMQYSNICFDFLDEEQPENGAEYLRQFLELIKSRTDNTNVYTIQLVDGWKEVDGKTGKQKVFTGRNLRFQLNQPAPYSPINTTKEIYYPNVQPILNNDSNNEVTVLLKNLLDEQKREIERLKQLIEDNNENDFDENYDEEEESEELPPPPTPKERIIGVIGGLMERDEVQEAIAGILISGQQWLTKKVFKQE